MNKVICYQLEFLPVFQLNAPVIIRVKVKKCEQNATITYIAMHC